MDRIIEAYLNDFRKEYNFSDNLEKTSYLNILSIIASYRDYTQKDFHWKISV